MAIAKVSLHCILFFFLVWALRLNGGAGQTYRSSRPEVFCKKGVLKNFAIFTGKHLCWSLFLIKLQAWKIRNVHRKASVLVSLFNKIAGLKASSFFKKRLQHSCFSVNIAKLLRIALFIELFRRLLLDLTQSKLTQSRQSISIKTVS